MALLNFPAFPGQKLNKRTPAFKTDVFRAESGRVVTTALQQVPIYAYEIDLQVRTGTTIVTDLGTLSEVTALTSIHNACSGSLIPVLFSDPITGSTVTASLPDSIELEQQSVGLYRATISLEQRL